MGKEVPQMGQLASEGVGADDDDDGGVEWIAFSCCIQCNFSPDNMADSLWESSDS